eukprot:TRINITY_DN12410_c0_g1_i1.p1 TRINITY_DN12410_c0_g1~~TRINITY_DN12410_c0_g1_i1.p1  ORF type:complete len:455 (+),score=78.79 TRINITY_DN12410_c0_g1_i1:126-1490(+)
MITVFILTLICSALSQHQNTSNPQAIVDTCQGFLESHLMQGEKWGLKYHYYRPSLEKYGPHQWLWDDGSHMIVWSHLNVTNSILSMRTMLSMQQPDGRVPEIIFWGNMTEEERVLVALQYSSDKFVDLTQMPVLPFSLRAIWEQTKDVSLLKEFLPKLVAFFDWWKNTRDVDGDGLVSIIHGWESGLDASPLYDLPYGVTVPQPTYWELYPQFDELVLEYKWRYDWNQTDILGRKYDPPTFLDSYFIVQDVGVNSVYAAGWGVLADLASNYDQNLSNYCRKNQQRVESTIISKCWSSQLNRFISFYHDKNGNRQEIQVEAVQSLFPLLLQNLPSSIVDTIVNTQLLNTSKFWTKYPIPTVSADAPQFQPVFTVDLMWRGPTWAFPNWFVMEGLTRHGKKEEATELLNRWIALYELSGIWEDYNPLTGDAYGAIGLGMSTLIVDWLYREGIVTQK